MPKSPFLSPFLATEEADEEAAEAAEAEPAVGPPDAAGKEEEDTEAKGVEGPTHSSSTLCTYFL